MIERKNLIFVWVGTFSILLISIITRSIFIGVFYGFLYLVFSLYRKGLAKEEKTLFHIVFNIGVVFSIILFLIYKNRYDLPYFLGGSDDYAYETLANFVSKNLGFFQFAEMKNIHPELQYHNSPVYVYLISILFRFGRLIDGFHTLVPKILNNFFLANLSIISFRILRHINLDDDRLSFRISMLSGIMPIMLYYAAHTYREIMIALIILFMIYQFIKYYSYKKLNFLQFIITISISLVLLVGLRKYVAVSLLLIIIFLYGVSHNKPNDGLLLSILLSFSGLFIFLLIFDFETLSIGETLINLIDVLARQYKTYVTYRAGLAPGLTTFIFTAKEPIGGFLRIIFLLFSPYPIIISKPEDVFLSLGTLIQIYYLPMLFVGLSQMRNNKNAYAILITFLVLFIGEAVISFSWRHIPMFFPIGVIIVGYGIYSFKSKRIILLNYQ